MSNSALNLSELAAGMPGLTSAKAIALAEAAAICLENQEHSPGVTLAASGQCDSAALHWQLATAQQSASNADLQDATEDGAAAIAILAVRNRSGKLVMERAVKGLGFDYWLGTENERTDDDLPFQNLTRLEVSGILKGTDSQVSSRVAVKRTQVEPSDHVCPSIIGVVEFSRPIIHLEGE